MFDDVKPIMMWMVSSLLVLFKEVTLDDLVMCVQLVAFLITIFYTIWKWVKDKRRKNNQIPNVKPLTPEVEVKKNGRRNKS